MKKFTKRLLVVFSCFTITTTAIPFSNTFTLVAEAHSGRTDSSGDHHDYKNKSGLGSYHYHHGYGAHLHTNGVCPYEANANDNADTNTADETINEANLSDYSAVFDADYYYQQNPDLQSAIGYDDLKLFQHFCTSGMAEGRKGCEDFDVNIYKENNADLQALYGDDLKSYYEHYRCTGCNEDRIHH